MITILITGGTIDDLEYDSPDQEPPGHQSLVPDLLDTNRVKIAYKTVALMQRDSKFLTDQDRELIYQQCLSDENDKIIIITLLVSLNYSLSDYK